MSKSIKRKCPSCLEIKLFRSDQKTCGCQTELPKEVSEIKGNEWVISLPKTRIHTLEEMIEYCNIDLSVWRVSRFLVNKWEMGAKNDSATVDVTQLFQVKIWLERKPEIVAAKNEVAELKNLAKKFSPLPLKAKKPTGNSGHMLEIFFADHHFGKLAWGVETGGANYDIKIAAEVFGRAFNSLLERTKSYSFDEVWFVVGNDLLHSDDLEGRTTHGTYQDMDARFQKTFALVRNIIISAIERLREVAKTVKVIMVPGNHDKLAVWHLGDSLECYFHKYTDVVIDNEPKYYKYHEYGNNMILFTHGDKGKHKDYPLLMATEQPEMFGRTLFREAHTGHTHQTNVQEQHGVRVRVLSALCPADAWHSENAYVGNIRASEAFVWHKQDGLIATAIYSDKDDYIEKASSESQKIAEVKI